MGTKIDIMLSVVMAAFLIVGGYFWFTEYVNPKTATLTAALVCVQEGGSKAACLAAAEEAHGTPLLAAVGY